MKRYHLSPLGVGAVGARATLWSYDADDAGAVFPDGEVDWSLMRDHAWDEYNVLVDHYGVEHGLIEVDKPIRDGRAMVVAVHHTDLYYKAEKAAKAGLYWHLPSRTPDFETTLSEMYRELSKDEMSETRRAKITSYVEQWRVMFPGDTRVDDFESDFVLDMLTRARVLRKGYNRPIVYFERVKSDD
jgi:hypothetical protein